MSALERHVGDRATWTRPQGGFFTWLELGEAGGADVARRALDAGVAVVPGAAVLPGGGRRAQHPHLLQPGLRGRLEEGIALLGPLLRTES